MPSTVITSFAELGRLYRELLPTHFAEPTPITDAAVLGDLQAILEPETGRIDNLTQVSLNGETFTGLAQQRISLGRFQTLRFTLSPDEMSYRLIDAEEVAAFAQTDEGWMAIAEFAKGARSGKKLNCKPGNIQCGGKCQSGKKNCFAGMSPDQKKQVQSAAKKAKGGATKRGGSGGETTVALNEKTRPTAVSLVQSRFLLPAAGQTSAPENKRNGDPLPIRDIRRQVLDKFGADRVTDLKNSRLFKMATDGQDIDLNQPDSWRRLYRQNVGVLPDERFSAGAKAINGIDVTKYFRPWTVFDLDPTDAKYTAPRGLRGAARKTAQAEANARREADIKAAYNRLVKRYHPDVGGDREVFERLTSMRDSLLVTFQ